MKKGNYAFIDSQNLYLGVKSQGWMLDFKRFRVYLRDKYTVVKAFTCIGYVEGNQLLYKKLCKVIVPNKKFSSLLRKFNPYIANINLWKDSLQKKG